MADIKFEAQDLVQDLPITKGTLTLSLLEAPVITALMYSRDYSGEFLVKPSEVQRSQAGKLAWSSQNQAFLFGKTQAAKGLYIADISDGWVFFSLQGENAYRVLERLVPLDLRPVKAKPEQSFRTQMGHLQALIITTSTGYEIGVMSSFAQTARHELIEVIETIEFSA